MAQFDALVIFKSNPGYLEQIKAGTWKPYADRWYCGHCIDGLLPQETSGWSNEQGAKHHCLVAHDDLLRGDPEKGYDYILGEDLIPTLRRHLLREQEWLNRALTYFGTIHTIDDLIVDLGE